MVGLGSLSGPNEFLAIERDHGKHKITAQDEMNSKLTKFVNKPFDSRGKMRKKILTFAEVSVVSFEIYLLEQNLIKSIFMAFL